MAKKYNIQQQLDTPSNASEQPKSLYSSFKKPLLVVFHATAIGIYGYAISWQFLCQPERFQSLPEVFGRFKFATFQCTCIQFVTYSICLVADTVKPGIVTRVRDYMVTAIALPTSAIICSSFWIVFAIDRELILKKQLEIDGIFPVWLNHVSHTIILPVNLIQIYFTRHHYASDTASLSGLISYAALYTAMLLYHRYQEGHYVYAFLDTFSDFGVAAYMSSLIIVSTGFYFAGKWLSSFFHVATVGTERKKSCAKTTKKSL